MPDLGGFLLPSLLIFVGLSVLAIALFAVEKVPAGGADYKRLDLLTHAEKAFFRVLIRAVGPRRLVLPKVRLSDVIAPRVTRGSGGAWAQAFSLIQGNRLDFLVCEEETLFVVCVVELDDERDQEPDRAKEASLVEKALEAGEIPMVRFPVARDYKAADLDACVRSAITAQLGRLAVDQGLASLTTPDVVVAHPSDRHFSDQRAAAPSVGTRSAYHPPHPEGDG